jgi:hypothetical protein
VTKTVRVNILSVANAAAVRKEKRNGRDVVIVPSATLPDNVVMNGVLYPAEEIAKGFRGLERTPAPLGHPKINGKFVSARDPEGINLGYIGAWNENVRQEGGRVLLDKVIDVEVANRTEGGKAVLAAIAKGGPINTSTGLLARMEDVANAKDHKRIARDFAFDHDAILLHEAGAATPEQGVGMLVNEKGEQEEIEVINSSLIEDADREIDWAGTRLVEALKRRDSVGTWERMKTAILEAVGLSEREPSVNRKEDDMAVSEEQFKTLSDEVKTLSEAMKPEALGKVIGEVVANAVKPLVDAQAEMVANQKTKDDAEHAELVTKVVKANLLNEETAKATPLATLRALAPKTEPGKAATLNSALGTPSTEGSGFKLPAGDKKE